MHHLIVIVTVSFGFFLMRDETRNIQVALRSFANDVLNDLDEISEAGFGIGENSIPNTDGKTRRIFDDEQLVQGSIEARYRSLSADEIRKMSVGEEGEVESEEPQVEPRYNCTPHGLLNQYMHSQLIYVFEGVREVNYSCLYSEKDSMFLEWLREGYFHKDESFYNQHGWTLMIYNNVKRLDPYHLAKKLGWMLTCNLDKVKVANETYVTFGCFEEGTHSACLFGAGQGPSYYLTHTYLVPELLCDSSERYEDCVERIESLRTNEVPQGRSIVNEGEVLTGGVHALLPQALSISSSLTLEERQGPNLKDSEPGKENSVEIEN